MELDNAPGNSLKHRHTYIHKYTHLYIYIYIYIYNTVLKKKGAHEMRVYECVQKWRKNTKSGNKQITKKKKNGIITTRNGDII